MSNYISTWNNVVEIATCGRHTCFLGPSWVTAFDLAIAGILTYRSLEDIKIIRSVVMTIRDIKNKGISKGNKAIYWYVDKCNGDRVYTCFSHQVSIWKKATNSLE